MSNKRRLWQIFGPVICAFILLLVVFLIPWERTFSKQTIYEAAASQNTIVFKGSTMKQEAFDEGYVPFYGSSELSRFDPLNPSVIAEKYHRNYRPFLLGGPGSQSLAQFLGMQGTVKQLKNKKAVVIISPQWFTKRGQDPNAFALYYSPLQTCNFLLSAKNNKTDHYAAKRLLEMPDVKGEIKNSLQQIAEGKKLTTFQKFYLNNRRRMLSNEDNFFSAFQLRDRVNKIQKKAKVLPSAYSVKALNKVAAEQAAMHTNSNNLGIDNTFYRTRLPKKVLKRLKGSQRHFDYVHSVEYGDFQLMLEQFAKQHTNVLFIIPPINGKWMKYTGLSDKMYQESIAKIKHQLGNQGFKNVVDLSKRGNEKYFMEDTIHLGWKGWVAVDQAVKPFMELPNRHYNYYMSNYYYSKKWQNKDDVKSVDLANKHILKSQIKVVRQAIDRLGIKGSVLVTSNRKPLLEDATNNRIGTSYLINSVQKSMTAAMVMREVQKGKLKLDDPLSKFYPNVDGADNVKISNLLTMTSGLDLETDQQLGTPKFISDKANIAHDAKYTVFDRRKLGKWHYTAVNYIYLCGILSKLEHKSYEKLFRETYIKPLKLKQTEFLWSSMAKLKSAGWVPGYERSSGQFIRVDHDQAVKDAHNELGAGSIVMSNADLAKTIAYILHGKLLTKENRKVLFKGKVPSYYNGGFYNLKKYKAANGAGEGYYTFLRTTKGAKDMIIIQDNHTTHDEFGKIKKKVNHIMSIMLHFN